MKNIIILVMLILGSLNFLQAQVSGNANYNHQKTYLNSELKPEYRINSTDQIMISIRGIYNENDSRKIAYFSLTQHGKNIEEVNSGMDGRISEVQSKIKSMEEGIGFHVDMISFVPKYAYETTKKLFSKRTYNEVPAGFELKKNLHISYSNAESLDEIISICAASEIYDLIKVEYISKNVEAIHDSLRTKAFEIYESVLGFHEKVSGADFSEKLKRMSDGFSNVFPKDRYKSYSAHASTNLEWQRNTVVNNTQKSVTQYYEPFPAINRDFVINPEILEPAIQTVYEMTVIIQIKAPKEVTPPMKEYYYMHPESGFQKIELN